MESLIFTPSIQRTYFGGQEAVTFEAFYTMAVQDYEAGMNVVQDMLAGEDPFRWNEHDDPEFYEEFVIIHRGALEAQIALAES
jgi:hypothetical protein